MNGKSCKPKGVQWYLLSVCLILLAGCQTSSERTEVEASLEPVRLAVARIQCVDNPRTPLVTEAGWNQPESVQQVWTIEIMSQRYLDLLIGLDQVSGVIPLEDAEGKIRTVTASDLKRDLVATAQSEGAELLLIYTSIWREPTMQKATRGNMDREALYRPRSEAFFDGYRYAPSPDTNRPLNYPETYDRKKVHPETLESYGILVECRTGKVVCTVMVNPVTPENRQERESERFVKAGWDASMLFQVLSENWTTVLNNYAHSLESGSERASKASVS